MKFGSRPSLRVYTISDAGYWYLGNGYARPNVFPQTPANFSMQLTDPVSVSAGAQGQDCHAERIVWVDGGLTQSEKLVKSYPQIAWIIAKVTADHLSGKGVIPGGNRCMCGEDIRRGDDLERRVVF